MSGSPRKVILDVDTGTDDALAIMLAACRPDVELVACTTVNGNVTVETATANTLSTLEFLGRTDIPVHPGLTRPLVRTDFPVPRAEMHHKQPAQFPITGTGTTSASNRDAVEFLVETFRSTTDELSIVATAPLSNIAALLAIHPRAVDAVAELVLMGGGHAISNATPSAEFNIWCDPEAAASVISAGFRKLTIVPLDATYQAIADNRTVAALQAAGTRIADTAARIIATRIEINDSLGRMPVRGTTALHDPLALAVLLDPDVVAARDLYGSVETAGSLTLGRTVFDVQNVSKKPANCRVALGTNRERFEQLLLDAFSRDPAALPAS